MSCSIIRFSLCVLSISIPFAMHAAGQSVPDQPQVTLRTTTDLVLVDVTVTDTTKNPVHHLDPADFTVFEDGHPQTVKVFEEHAAAAPVPIQPTPKLAPGTFSNFTSVPPTGALNILLVDKLNTPMEQQTVLRDQVLKFLEEMPAGNRMAIFILTTRLSLLQGFTTDPAVLRAALDSLNGNPKASPLINRPIQGDTAGGDNLDLEGLEQALMLAPGGASAAAALQQLERDVTAAETQHRADYTLDALNALAHYLSGIPGRKNLIWLSGSFPISILPVPGARDPFSPTGVATAEYRDTVNLMARSQVAVYPIDVKGMMPSPVWNANSPAGQGGDKYAKFGRALTQDDQQFETQNTNEHGAMNQMAAATGGKAFEDTNDLKAAVATAIDSGANYYTLAYSPTNRDWNGAYRKIEVKLDRPELKLAYRRGYYADDPSKPTHRDEQSSAAGAAQYNPMRVAMQHGAPDPTELIFQADVRPSTDGTDPSPATSNQPGSNFAGPFRNYAVTFTTKVNEADCEAGPNGVRQCALVFVTYVYDADGTVVNKQTNGINVGIPGDKYAAAMTRNFVYRQEISVPVKGEYYLRMGMRDDNNGGVGALETPVAALEKLTPASAGGEAAPAGKLEVK